MYNIEKLQPLPFEGVADYHVHCDYSVDAEGTVEEFCEAAIRRNLAEICFTTHYDANPRMQGDIEYIRVDGKNLPVSPDNLTPYVDHIRRAADKYFPQGLSVKVGVEIGWFEGCEETVQKLRARFDLDYILCGIHELDNICFCCQHSVEKCFSRYDPEQVAEVYFRQVNSAVSSGLFDSIAHFNYYLRSGIDYYGDKIKSVHRQYLEETFRLLVANSTGLEVNTSGMRHGLDMYYPSVEVINAAKKAGVEVNFLGSDAHHPSQIGFDFEAALALVPNTIRGCDDQ